MYMYVHMCVVYMHNHTRVVSSPPPTTTTTISGTTTITILEAVAEFRIKSLFSSLSLSPPLPPAPTYQRQS